MKNSVQRSESQLAAVTAGSVSPSRSSGGEEEGEPGGRHEQAAAAVRATPPRDQPARGEGTADQAQDDVDRIRRAVVEHHRRQHGQLGHRGGGPQREPDTAHVDHRGEPVDQPGAACAPRPRNRVARHRPAVRHEGPPARDRSGCRSTVDRAKAGPESPRDPTRHRPVGGQRAAGCRPPLRRGGRRSHLPRPAVEHDHGEGEGEPEHADEPVHARGVAPGEAERAVADRALSDVEHHRQQDAAAGAVEQPHVDQGDGERDGQTDRRQHAGRHQRQVPERDEHPEDEPGHERRVLRLQPRERHSHASRAPRRGDRPAG